MPRKKTVHAASIHTTREAESRIHDPVHEDEGEPWVRGGSLDMPPANPGMDQRWIRVEAGGQPDSRNWSRKYREGWRPRKPDTVPANYDMPKIEHGRFAGVIGVEGMVLCERPMKLSERRAKMVRDATDRRTNAIEHDLERFNKANSNPAYGGIQMATESKRVYETREVPVMGKG